MPQVTIRAESCKSCGYCVKFCPKGILAVGTEVNSKGYPYVTAAHPENCIGCAIGTRCAEAETATIIQTAFPLDSNSSAASGLSGISKLEE